MGFLVQAVGPCLTGNRNHRRMIQVGIRNAGNQVGCTGPERRQADTGAAGQTAIDIRHECCALLMAGGDKPDTGIEQRIHDIQVFFSRDSEDVLHTFVLQALHEQLCSVHSVPFENRDTDGWFTVPLPALCHPSLRARVPPGNLRPPASSYCYPPHLRRYGISR